VLKARRRHKRQHLHRRRKCDGSYAKSTRAHTHRILIREQIWKPNGSSRLRSCHGVCCVVVVVLVSCRRVKGALCAKVKRLRVSYNQNDETLSRNSLRCLSEANLTIAVNCSCRAPLTRKLVAANTPREHTIEGARKRDS